MCICCINNDWLGEVYYIGTTACAPWPFIYPEDYNEDDY